MSWSICFNLARYHLACLRFYQNSALKIKTFNRGFEIVMKLQNNALYPDIQVKSFSWLMLCVIII